MWKYDLYIEGWSNIPFNHNARDRTIAFNGNGNLRIYILGEGIIYESDMDNEYIWNFIGRFETTGLTWNFLHVSAMSYQVGSVFFGNLFEGRKRDYYRFDFETKTVKRAQKDELEIDVSDFNSSKFEVI